MAHATTISLMEDDKPVLIGVWVGKLHYTLELEDGMITQGHLTKKNEILMYDVKIDKEMVYSLITQLPLLNEEERILLLHKKLGIPQETMENIFENYKRGY